jgi:hypothetical protein
MRTSLNDIRLTEKYLNNLLPIPNRLLFEARVLTNPTLRMNVWLQRKLLQLVRLYHDEKIRKKVSGYHEEFLRDPQHAEYRRRILELFNPRKS